MYEFFIEPFIVDLTMSYALVAGLFLCISASMLGVFLVIRRMSLVADAMSHALLPGVAIGMMLAGSTSLVVLAGGVIAGLIVAIGAGVIMRNTHLKEDASFATTYILSLSLGMILVGNDGHELSHILFGSIYNIADIDIWVILIVSSVTMILLALFYRPIVMECLDPLFMRMDGGLGRFTHILFLVMLAFNLVAGYKVLGTLLVVSVMLLPAITSTFITRSLEKQILLSSLISILILYFGLVIAYNFNLQPSAIIALLGGVCYLLALFFGSQKGILRRTSKIQASPV
ncbi:metal ABC transporter permease [Taylorella equigenitalis]|uniref:metal ABC transporter permease n=1 Tax=Taylorella equigenitalis TaxID=29575 RepID=UPI0004190E42|nr:metal ABC transporter permease [Taylorella equigenitalis]WDU53514.1 metal ABC transporter permease [Taylorella equigenitalis]